MAGGDPPRRTGVSAGPGGTPRLEIRRFEARDADPIARLNERLRAGNAPWHVWTERPSDGGADRPISERLFVAAQGNEVRGGVWLREHEFRLGGESLTAGWAKYPVAESLVDPAYSGVPGSLLFQLLRLQPRLMALGLGGHGGPFARFLAKMGWKGDTIPFLFRVVRPFRVLRHFRYARRSLPRRVAMDLAAWSGAGWAGLSALHGIRGREGRRAARGYDAQVVPSFGPWADALWSGCRDAYGFVALRSSAMLNHLYPASFAEVTRLRIRTAAGDAGWACVTRFDFRDKPDRVFGPLRVGMLADGLAAPADVPGVVAAATAHLQALDVDLIFSNQAHPAWVGALAAAGFLPGPSNFAFYRSPAMEKLLSQGEVASRGLHLNRGDCDGPVWFSA